MRIDSLASCVDQSDRPIEARDPAPDRDAAYAARPRLRFLSHALVAAARNAGKYPESGVPPMFFFDPARQAELDAAKADDAKPATHPLEALIDDILPGLFASVETRRAARAIPGLHEAAATLAPRLRAAKELAELLAVPDDETVLVLHPLHRAGYRLHVRGVANAAQFQVLLAGAITGRGADGFLPGPSLPVRLGAFYRDADPIVPAGVPTAVEPRWQLYRPEALGPGGLLPDGFRGCEHWIWESEPLGSIARVDGERVVLLGEPVVRAKAEVERRFPALAAELRLLEILGPFVVAERLGRLVGQPVPVRIADKHPVRVAAKAA